MTKLADSEDSSTKTETSMKVSDETTRLTVLVSTSIPMGPSTSATEKKTNKREKESKSGLTERLIKGIIRMEKSQAKEF